MNHKIINVPESYIHTLGISKNRHRIIVYRIEKDGLFCYKFEGTYENYSRSKIDIDIEDGVIFIRSNNEYLMIASLNTLSMFDLETLSFKKLAKDIHVIDAIFLNNAVLSLEHIKVGEIAKSYIVLTQIHSFNSERKFVALPSFPISITYLGQSCLVVYKGGSMILSISGMNFECLKQLKHEIIVYSPALQVGRNALIVDKKKIDLLFEIKEALVLDYIVTLTSFNSIKILDKKGLAITKRHHISPNELSLPHTNCNAMILSDGIQSKLVQITECDYYVSKKDCINNMKGLLRLWVLLNYTIYVFVGVTYVQSNKDDLQIFDETIHAFEFDKICYLVTKIRVTALDSHYNFEFGDEVVHSTNYKNYIFIVSVDGILSILDVSSTSKNIHVLGMEVTCIYASQNYLILGTFDNRIFKYKYSGTSLQTLLCQKHMSDVPNSVIEYESVYVGCRIGDFYVLDEALTTILKCSLGNSSIYISPYNENHLFAYGETCYLINLKDFSRKFIKLKPIQTATVVSDTNNCNHPIVLYQACLSSTLNQAKFVEDNYVETLDKSMGVILQLAIYQDFYLYPITDGSQSFLKSYNKLNRTSKHIEVGNFGGQINGILVNFTNNVIYLAYSIPQDGLIEGCVSKCTISCNAKRDVHITRVLDIFTPFACKVILELKGDVLVIKGKQDCIHYIHTKDFDKF